MFVPASNRIEIKPLAKDSSIYNDKEELVELGEVVNIGKGRELESGSFFSDIYNVGEIIAFEGWGCTKISYKGEDKWVVSTDKNVILGKFTKDDSKQS